MEIRYENTHADFTACHEALWRHLKPARRNDFYAYVFWYLTVVALGIYVSLRHEEIFIACIFLVLAGYCIKQNWSFARSWNAQADQFASMMPECSCMLTIDETGATERFSGVTLHVSWEQIHDYTIEEGRLFIYFLKDRTFIILFRHLAPNQLEEIVGIIERHGKRKREVAGGRKAGG